jgi:hypothetical protein
MNQNIYRIFSLLAVLALFISACGASTPAAPTPDAAAMATSAVQTAEARFTQQALVDLATRVASAPTSTPVPEQAQPTATTEAGATAASYEYTPGCVFATYVADLTIPDGMLIAPGTTFTKTWRIKNTGSCKWDPSFAMVFFSGDKMSEQISFPLPRTVYPGQEVDVSIVLTAPAANGKYSSEWRMALPAGTAGVGQADDNLTVNIEVADKADRAFAVTSVVYDPVIRTPQKGCTDKGATYTFTALISVNGPGEIIYEWDRQPDDGVFEGGKLKFTAAGSKQVSFTWTMTATHVQNIERWVALSVRTSESLPSQQFGRLYFTYSCNE